MATRYNHWENLQSAGGLCDEVMTGTLKSTTQDALLSAVTIQALVDLGHTVDASSEGVLPTLAGKFIVLVYFLDIILARNIPLYRLTLPS